MQTGAVDRQAPLCAVVLTSERKSGNIIVLYRRIKNAFCRSVPTEPQSHGGLDGREIIGCAGNLRK